MIEAGGPTAPESARPALRDLDWRFLLARSRWSRAACDEGSAGITATEVADAIVRLEDADTGSCDLVLLDNPGPFMFRDAGRSAAVGGWCVASWGRLPGPEVMAAAASAGFTAPVLYVAYPGRPARRWVPVDRPAARRWMDRDASAAGSGVRPRRWLRLAVWRVRLRAGRLPCIGLFERAASPTAPAIAELPIARLVRAADDRVGRQVGPVPLLVVGGRDDVNKATALFLGPTAEPASVAKFARTERAATGLRHEAAHLDRLAGLGVRDDLGVPRLLGVAPLGGGGSAVVETGLGGVPLSSMAKRGSFAELAGAGTEWLIRLGLTTLRRHAEHRRAGESRRAGERRGADAGEILAAFRGPGAESTKLDVLNAIGPLPLVAEHRDFAPWNVVRRSDGSLAALDWESAEPDGWPALDLLYFLTHLAIATRRARSTEQRVAVYRELRDPDAPLGRIADRCELRYATAIGFERASLDPLRDLLWAIHDRSESLRGNDGQRAADRLSRALWAAEQTLPSRLRR